MLLPEVDATKAWDGINSIYKPESSEKKQDLEPTISKKFF
jgi:hypothetical protein